MVVPGAGIEPARLAAGDFESPASTNFTTRASRDASAAAACARREVVHYKHNFRKKRSRRAQPVIIAGFPQALRLIPRV